MRLTGKIVMANNIIVSNDMNLSPELSYILDWIFNEVFGLSWTFKKSHDKNFVISIDGKIGSIEFPNIVFSVMTDKLCLNSVLPQSEDFSTSFSCTKKHPNLKKVPILFGDKKIKVHESSAKAILPLDVFGSIFYMLSRLEEWVQFEHSKDVHGRFVALSSVSESLGIIERPIVDEYLAMLGGTMKNIWPDVSLEINSKTQNISCDIDLLSEYKNGFYRNLRGIVSDIIRCNNFKCFNDQLVNRLAAWRNHLKHEEYFKNVIWMSEIGKYLGEKFIFYIMVNRTHRLDGNYDIQHKDVLNLMSKVLADGHKIGIHFSYNAFDNAKLMEFELDKFYSVMRRFGDGCDSISKLESRQHYLRWDPKVTPQILDALGVQTDSTLGFADRVGFRCGTSREFPMYCFHTRRKLNLRQRPLIVMETSLFSKTYEGLCSTDLALTKMLELKNKSMALGGNFTMLWHNSSFPNSRAHQIYFELLSSKST